MGLFIGASILTILELFDYAYEVSLNYPHLLSLQLKCSLFSSSRKKIWGKRSKH